MRAILLAESFSVSKQTADVEGQMPTTFVAAPLLEIAL
jgi:hypothetical protein